MWQWLCFEQYNLEPNLGTARFWLRSLGKTEAELGEKLTEKRRLGFAALDVLERGLTGGISDRGALHARRHRPLCVYARRGGRRVFAGTLPGDPRLVRAHCGPAGPPTDHGQIAAIAGGV